MGQLKKNQLVVVLILALLSALEPFSIDLYLPGFLKMANYYQTDLKSVQFSISTFLAGFAVGQLFWGILSDRYGRKWPTILSLLLFIAATAACIYSNSIEQFWVARFFQAFAGCAGVVIARAVVNEYFDASNTMQIFSLLAIISGVAPIIGPIAGNFLISHFEWQSTFVTLLILGIICLLTVVFFLPETRIKSASKPVNLLGEFKKILRVKTFLKYTLIGSLTYSILMIYLANAPYLIMEYGKLSSNAFSYIFAINAIGLIFGAWFSNSVLSRWWSVRQVIKGTVFAALGLSTIFLLLCIYKQPIEAILVLLFFLELSMGILFPTTTKLALEPFNENSGSASALLGSLQLVVTFFISAITNIIPADLLFLTGLALFICHILYVVCLMIREPKLAIPSN
ncbi:multidrug effflux MFS transporter [Flavobacterium sp. HSC-61S13]|uniref:multidrug effflux MFS transporter n=1 Tax=Flavobacterium sp. HSC-61S13 TaxID=2910963 RepID=UPI00209FBC6B|nr:multidrug effflux MFS transporter [Flavobacterium sp. HSC-61S13]MCP1996450.1 DHA1 family bicyclomycin/chloramphenicol resistance-like MFS transporter [Flavobacterium sp. HSC-61S13]